LISKLKQTIMKKLLTLLLLSVATVSAHAAFFVTNNASYDVVLVLWAHDATNPAPCSYYCQRFTVPSGGTASFNNANAPGLWWGQPWGIPATVNAAAIWDAVEVYPTVGALPYNTIGAPGSCASSTSYSSAVPGYSITATWIPVGGNNVVLDISN
jgi:hypothetical protein